MFAHTPLSLVYICMYMYIYMYMYMHLQCGPLETVVCYTAGKNHFTLEWYVSLTMYEYCRHTTAHSVKCVTCTTITPFRRTGNCKHTR